jgi:hypothetical protein
MPKHRIVAFAGIFLIVGAAISLAQTWWSVHFHESHRTQGLIKLLGFPYIANSGRSHSGWMVGPFDEHGNRWRIRVELNQSRAAFQVRYEAIPFGDGSERDITPDQLPGWTRTPDTPTSPQTRGRLKIVEQVGGWPFRAWRGEYRIDGALTSPRCIACFPDRRQVWLGSWTDVTLYPYQPIFPGVIFNALIYAGVLFVVIQSTRHYARRYRRWSRLSRALCPNCNYDIRGLHTCPECGQQLFEPTKPPAARDQPHG